MEDTLAAQLVMRVQIDLTAAMKQRNQVEISTLKSLLASFSNAEAVEITNQADTEVPRKELEEPDLVAIIQAEINELQQAIDQLELTNSYRLELEQKKIILEKYL